MASNSGPPHIVITEKDISWVKVRQAWRSFWNKVLGKPKGDDKSPPGAGPPIKPTSPLVQPPIVIRPEDIAAVQVQPVSPPIVQPVILPPSPATTSGSPDEPRAECPYCGEPLEGQPQQICPSCKTPHHTTCWRANGGCTTAFCPRNPRK